MDKVVQLLGTFLGYLTLLALPTWFLMLGLGGIGVSLGFLPLYALVISARLMKVILNV